MSLDRDLIATIKSNFTQKSSAQLQEIASANEPERWSPEAVAAARELLQERVAGGAEEPASPEPELPRPIPMPDPYSLAFLTLGVVGFFGLTGIAVVPVMRRRELEPPDVPIPFGPRMAWLAVETNDTAAVAAALRLEETHKARWAEGIEAASKGAVFVTPPLADWTLAASAALFPPDRVETFVKPLLEQLSDDLGEAQYFGTHSDVGLQIWAKARKGRLVRGYGWLGERNLVLWNEGALTKEERDLGFRAAPALASTAVTPTLGTTGPPTFAPDEHYLMQLACLWSIDPSSLDGQFMEPEKGLLGRATWGKNESR